MQIVLLLSPVLVNNDPLPKVVDCDFLLCKILSGLTFIENTLYMILEYCSRGSLLDWLRSEEGDQANHEMLGELAKQVINCVGFLEMKRLVHRDIAARN